MSEPVDLNAARKARAGHADTGLCRCGKHLRMFCRNRCMGALIEAALEPDDDERYEDYDPAEPDDDYGGLTLVPDEDSLADATYKRWREDRDQD